MIDITKEIEFLVENWDKIPDSFKTNLQGSDYYRNNGVIPNVPLEEHIVILLLDRQRPSVEPSYDFDEERISVTRTGKVIWGFDSGCSCPSPWHDSYPDCYSCDEGWKEFSLNIEKFDHGAVEECLAKIAEIRKAIT